MSRTKKDVGMGLFVQCLYALSLHLVAVVFGTAIPTFLNIFEKMFYLLYTYGPENHIGGVVFCLFIHILELQ